MKNAISYILILIVLGTTSVLPLYYWHLFEQESDITTSQNLYQYSQGNHVELTIKVPISLPYTSDWNNTEANGLMEYKGDYYTVINKKYENDTLYFKCIQNSNAREIFSSLTNHVEKLVKDSPTKENHKTQLALIFKIISHKSENVNHKFLPTDFYSENTQTANYAYSNTYQSIKTEYNAPPPRFA